MSFHFCFDGIPLAEILTSSVAVLGCAHVERRLRVGLEGTADGAAPRLLVVYGRLRINLGCNLLEVSLDWERLRSL